MILYECFYGLFIFGMSCRDDENFDIFCGCIGMVGDCG